MSSDSPSYRGYRFPPEIISHAVWHGPGRSAGGVLGYAPGADGIFDQGDQC